MQELLNSWSDAEGIKRGLTIYQGRTPMSPGLCGRCLFDPDGHQYIAINAKLTGFLARSVLWHEFVHSLLYIRTGERQGHNLRFYGTLWTRPQYAIGEFFAAIATYL